MSIDPTPPRLGRYEIAGEIATGGMAQILLGRLTGPGGFERAVAIKRVRREYARVRSFREMFLDEARIAASIRHPNVVQHFELSEEGDELFLVMEYLEGEPVSSLVRRCLARARPLPLDLAVHIVACAAAGLHAAHQATDLDGRPREVVHRDVSPHNVFVGYDGRVKVIDFGIAKAKDRITQTEAGLLKGKFAYMSPEQARGEPLDHRSDVFALGILLHELTTGRRLFHRATPLASLRAVGGDPIPRPSTLSSGYPEALERVCMSALERDRGARLPSAADLRAALLDLARLQGWPIDPEATLSERMHELFADRIEACSELLRAVRSGSRIVALPVAEPDHDGESAIALRPSVQGHALAGERARARASRSGRRYMYAGGVLLVLLAIAAALRFEPETDQSAAAAPLLASEAPPQVTTIAPELADRPATLEPGARVAIAIESVPAGARIFVAEALLGVTPATVQLPRGDRPIALRIVRDGYLPLASQVVPDMQQRLHFSLLRAPRQAARGGAGPERGARRDPREVPAETREVPVETREAPVESPSPAAPVPVAPSFPRFE